MSLTRVCIVCEIEHPIEYFYFYKPGKPSRSKLCKKCENKRDRMYDPKAPENCGGSESVIKQPNRYRDQWQKEQTFQFLQLMGWKFNEEKGIWYDDIKKD